MTIELVWESKRSLYIEYSGTVTGSELIQFTLEISGDSRLDEIRDILSDWRQIESPDFSTETIEELVAYTMAMSKSNPRIKHAVVMSGDETGQALASFYRFLTEEIVWEIELFHTLEEARAWLA